MNRDYRTPASPASLRRIDHLGIVVGSLDDASRLWVEELGLKLVLDEDSAYGRMRFLQCGEVQIELIEPVAGSPLATWREREGDRLHHIAFAVDNAEAALAELRDIKCAWRDDAATEGTRGTRIAFLKPARAGAPVLEFVEHPRS